MLWKRNINLLTLPDNSLLSFRKLSMMIFKKGFHITAVKTSTATSESSDRASL